MSEIADLADVVQRRRAPDGPGQLAVEPERAREQRRGVRHALCVPVRVVIAVLADQRQALEVLQARGVQLVERAAVCGDVREGADRGIRGALAARETARGC